MPTLTSNSISDAWKQAATACISAPKHELYALTVEIIVTDELDDLAFRNRLNRILLANGRGSVDTVARTIFPIGLWNPERPRSDLYERYEKILPKLRQCPLNRRGIYFERLIQYPLDRRPKAFADRRRKKCSNQLEFVINTYVARKNHRRSALQASLYNPFVDASDSPRLGFPCLQQVAFVPQNDRSLALIGFYPVHYVFERAYGNYLGLAHLGRFMAHEMRLRLDRIICVAGVAQFEVSETAIRSLRIS